MDKEKDYYRKNVRGNRATKISILLQLTCASLLELKIDGNVGNRRYIWLNELFITSSHYYIVYEEIPVTERAGAIVKVLEGTRFL